MGTRGRNRREGQVQGVQIVLYLGRSTGLSLPDTCSPPPPLPYLHGLVGSFSPKCPPCSVEFHSCSHGTQTRHECHWFHGEHRPAKLTVSCSGPLKPRIVLAVQCHRPFGSSIIKGGPWQGIQPSESLPGCSKARKRGSGAGAKNPTVTRYGSRSVGAWGALPTGSAAPHRAWAAVCRH